MLVLVDYDNVDSIEQSRGLVNLAQLLLSKLDPTVIPHGSAAQVRLYGGWYEGRQLTKRAQRLSMEIAQHFPGVIDLPSVGQMRQSRVTMELARSLLLDPANDLFHTFRGRNRPPRLEPLPLPFGGCADEQGCMLLAVHTLLRTGSCPHGSCRVGTADVMVRPEQKLVDTMLTADLIATATSQQPEVMIVTTDDDLWPGISTALRMGAPVHHVHPKPGRRTPAIYLATANAGYHQYGF